MKGFVELVGLPGDVASAAADSMFRADRYNDGLLCIQIQTLPNDASGFTTWLVFHDNTAKPKT